MKKAELEKKIKAIDLNKCDVGDDYENTLEELEQMERNLERINESEKIFSKINTLIEIDGKGFALEALENFIDEQIKLLSRDNISCADTLYYCPECYVSNIQTEDSIINPMDADINFCVQCGWRIDAEVLMSQPFLNLKHWK